MIKKKKKTWLFNRGLTEPTPVLLLENSMDGGAWWAIVHGVTKSQTRLSDLTELPTEVYLLRKLVVSLR